MVVEHGDDRGVIEGEKPFPTDGIFGLKNRIDGLYDVDREIAARVLRVTNSWGKTNPPASMAPFLERGFGSVEKVENQPIVRVDVIPLGEGTLFNHLRSRRPGMSSLADLDEKVQEIIDSSLAKGDVFANPLDGTPESTWGRLQGNHSVTAENVAKFDGEHSLVIFNQPHPLRYGREEVVDYLETAKRVWDEQRRHDKDAEYPFLIWQAMGKSASSVTHGHIQVVSARERHYPKVDRLRTQAADYKDKYGANFWTDYEHLHDKLGLMIRRNGSCVMAHVAPIKEKEIWMLGMDFDREFMNDTFDLLDVYLHRLGVRSFTLSIAKPPIATTEEMRSRGEDWSEFPVLLRLVDRGDPTSPTADIGAMELYAASVVASDPYDVKRVLSEHWGEAA